jgi:hypothetical protein
MEGADEAEVRVKERRARECDFDSEYERRKSNSGSQDLPLIDGWEVDDALDRVGPK